ncbi:zinc finger and BTB domain-containing protein 26-like isoform X1 [Scophthalmus maximus]|uniref:zinc finger and BTB domain-containing protein 26-like isoform X1 n=1 Tax=Scophthalmus maximus TaxID=52904 RepID=UPI001FA901AD|nr:zinc finger and BTB domain-containing protein 26-like isoform X1 [Scophthalmus maximus]XP_035463370.2 zinc finger and BTB domain-containing protein 26-like isoform X1 [Scophthalmus maximus]XP_035463371.2 zinc finger and BTB domain-containing protein 26-like isoform X1 [Scophthalmus maximus]
MSGSSDTLKFRLPTHGDAVLGRINALREDHRFCDVTLLLGGPRRATVQPLHFHGHRVVLAASSDFLRDQFLLHQGRAELSVGVVSSVEVGKRLLLSCYTGLLEVPLRELVNYLTTASALQMSHVVEKCAQAVSQYLSPTLAFLKPEGHSEEKEILQVASGWPGPSIQSREERDAAQPSTSHQEASAEEGDTIVIQSKSSKGAKVESQELREASEEGRAVKAEIQSSEDAACCFNTVKSEEVEVHTNKPSHQVHHTTSALRCELHPPTGVQDHVSSTTIGTQQEEVADSSHIPNEKPTVAAQLQERGELTGSSLFCVFGARPSISRRSGDELTEDSDGILVQRPFLCRRCDRVFQHLESYVGHLKEHRRHQCLVCGEGFTQRSNLSHHIHIHSGVKPFRCPLCHKTFSRKATLQDHFNLHTGAKPHRCKYCAVHFAHKPGLRRHLKDVHGKSNLQNMPKETGHLE